MAKMNWSKANKTKRMIEHGHQPAKPKRDHDHMVINGHHRHVEAKRPAEVIEKAVYRSVGSVMQNGDQWHAVDGFGKTVGVYPTRWQAWMHADKFGLEITGLMLG